MLYLFTVHLNFSEAPLTYGMDIIRSGLTLFFRGIFLFDLSITELINQMGQALSCRSCVRISASSEWSCFSWHTIVALWCRLCTSPLITLQWLIQLEVEVMTGVCRFSVDFYVQYRSLPDDQHDQKLNYTVSSCLYKFIDL